MSDSDGRLVPQYEVHCWLCEHPALGLGKTKAGAERELRRLGWAMLAKNGRWVCGCRAKPATERKVEAA